MKQGSLTIKSDIADFIAKTYFDGKMKKIINKKVASNKVKHLETEKKLTAPLRIFCKFQKKDVIFDGRMYFTGDDGY